MTVLSPTRTIEVSDYKEFCSKFDINSKYIAGDDGTDEELIILELNKIIDKKIVLNFVENRIGGYFLIQVFE